MYVSTMYVYMSYICAYVATTRELLPAHGVSLRVSMILPVYMDSLPVQH